MNLVIEKKTFIEIEKINLLKNHIDKLVSKKIEGKKVYGQIEIDIAYIDNNQEDCFKAITFDYELELDEIKIIDVALGSVFVFVVEGNGVNIEYSLNLIYEASKEIEIIEDVTDNTTLPILDKVEVEVTTVPEETKLDEIKESIKETYEEKLENELEKREDVKIITTKSSSDEIDFLRFFDENVSPYFKIKTLECKSKDELKIISKEYNVDLSILENGYDNKRQTVTFKLNE